MGSHLACCMWNDFSFYFLFILNIYSFLLFVHVVWFACPVLLKVANYLCTCMQSVHCCLLSSWSFLLQDLKWHRNGIQILGKTNSVYITINVGYSIMVTVLVGSQLAYDDNLILVVSFHQKFGGLLLLDKLLKLCCLFTSNFFFRYFAPSIL